MKRILVANRGEIAIRVLRAARDMGIQSVAVYSSDDANSQHRILADAAVALAGSGPAAYIDIDAIIAAARSQDCDAIHPGYGFLSERSDFAQACAAAGMVFIGPAMEHLALFGDKGAALQLAKECEVPVMPATHGGATLAEIQQFFDDQGGVGIVIKAVGGGGGRGMRVVKTQAEIPELYARCRSEAMSAFGVDALYAERLVNRARHIEVQIAGDGVSVVALGDRDCTLQRRFQKVVEIAPSPVLTADLRARILAAARKLASRVKYQSLGTFEFLVEEDEQGKQTDFVFIEANPRLQVEHTITEQVTGIDLVALQIGLAQGRSLESLGIDPRNPPQLKGYAIQVRVTAESTDAAGMARPAHGRLERFDPPAGPDVRVDTHAYSGYSPAPAFDTLLAKLIVSSPSADFASVVRRLRRSLAEFRITGVPTNIHLLRALVGREDFEKQHNHTRYLETILPELVSAAALLKTQQEAKDALVGEMGRQASAPAVTREVVREQLDDGQIASYAPLSGRIVEVSVGVNESVRQGQPIAVIEAMKMEHSIVADFNGRVLEVRVIKGEQTAEGDVLVVLEPEGSSAGAASEALAVDLDVVRPDLQAVLDRHAFLYDAARPDAVAKRRSRGQRTARENLADLCDDGSFVEYGALVVAAQASRRTKEDLIANTPADGIVTGIANINGAEFGYERSLSAVMAYDATVLAGTQGKRNHIKTDRLVERARRDELPLVLFAEGGGGRPGDVDFPFVSGLYQPSFAALAELSGEVPLVGIVSGRCFAGNAAFLGVCDVIIADKSSNIGMAGPAMIEGGGLGIFKPEQVGPAPLQFANGVIDILVENEAQAVVAAKHYLSMFQGRVQDWSAPNPLALRHVVPENRLRVYDSRKAIEGIADVGSVLMLRSGFGHGMHTALARVEGQPVGIIANNPQHLGGAIDADAADKAARFMNLCDVHGLPIITLIDTPGFMVGPDEEAKAQVRHVSRMFVTAAKLRVAILAIALRKGYGLGAMAMAGGGFRSSSCAVSWPTGEFGPMGLEGSIQLGFKKELESVPDGPQRRALYDQLVARAYERGHAINVASTAEIDAVIDPAETRTWIRQGIASASLRAGRARRSFVDTW
ncbi:carbamoyl-phosphate synthase large subunit [Comamonas aquatica]|uniref:acetyl-CoA carboxylase family protein n=1 Tax=Comamonas aquatica TaxID=225991 RepID=UPI001C587EFA|nr:carboxyl transferase domain-containing protein [Comamonas aquatica]MDH0899875.1 carbamoyl-phosphate synthase large subunit [Comamonas aquatica]QXW17620.1 carbamoyl-phosphate synthase large subunit [Comamonas aquatica]